MFDLAGEVALVTGGAKGIGKGIAKALKQARAKVIIGDIDKNRGKEVANEMGVEFRHFDVTNKDLVDYTIQNIYEEYGKISILCSNAGIFPRTSIENMTEKDWDEVQNINMKGTFFVTKAALKYMKNCDLLSHSECTTSNTDLFDYRAYYRAIRMGTLWS